MPSERSDKLILLLSILPVILGIALVVRANSDGSIYFAGGPADLPGFVPAPVVLALQPFLNWVQSLSYMSVATREEIAFGIVLGGIGFIILVMSILDLFNSARRQRKARKEEEAGAQRVIAPDEPLQMYVSGSRRNDGGMSA